MDSYCLLFLYFQKDLRWMKNMLYIGIKIGFFHLKKKPTNVDSLIYRLCTSILWLYAHKIKDMNIDIDLFKVSYIKIL